MGISKFRRYQATTVFIGIAVFVWMLICPNVIFAFDFHASTAHGNDTYGVNRSGTGYDIGDCANCHDTFNDSICGQYNFMLFFDEIVNPCQVGCLTCHSSSATWQPTVNYPYAKNFGGASGTWYGDIYTQFCSINSLPDVCGSRHHLGRIWLVIKDNAYNWGFNADPHPCVACHNPHADQQNHPVAIDGEGKLNTAIRRPSHYKSTDPLDMLWGDDANERMSSYASQFDDGVYQAPYYNTTSATFEPANNSTSDGSNLPDYVTFCMDCHQHEQTDPDRGGATVQAIVWDYSHGPYPDIHGAAPANTLDAGGIGCMATEGSLKAPYDTYEPNQSNYVLSCLDCHEPHGNYKRLHLIRLRINGESVGPDNPTCDETTNGHEKVCARCHNLSHGSTSCQFCHGNGISDPFHGSTFECSAGVGDCVAGQPDTCPPSF